jgi:DNA-binding PadR family transcriptional regulator
VTAEIKLSDKDRRILAVLLSDATNLSGFTLAKLSRTSGARVYLLLDKLENNQMVTAEWEIGLEPGNRFYRLTAEGRAWALNALGLKG